MDLASGHGLIAIIMLLLDDTSPLALAVDAKMPVSAGRLLTAFEAAWPRLGGRLELRTCSLDEVELCATDVVVSAHACGDLTDRVLELALGARARVAVLPCCHSEGKCALGGLGRWVDASLAIDMTRAARARAPAGTRFSRSQALSLFLPYQAVLVFQWDRVAIR